MSMTTTASRTPFSLTTYFRPALVLGLSALTILVFGSIPDLGIHAKVAFITFGLAIIAWTLTDLNDTYVALAAAIVFAATGIDEPAEFFETLGDPLIWLLLASFLIAAAVKASGLSERLASLVTLRARTVNQLFILLTLVLIGTTFLIPSTSGRAALMLPVFLALRTVMPNDRVRKALSLLFPSVILLSAIASLIGAGGHLITADILWRTGGDYLGFGRWMAMGLPFALASSFAAVGVIMFMFMNRADRAEALHINDRQFLENQSKPWTSRERFVIVVAGALVVLWASESLHGINSTLIAILGALLLTSPLMNVISFKSALKEVDWSMLVFMAATLELGEALIESGGAQWLVENLFAVFEGNIANSPLAVVSLVAVIGLLSHLIITSRSSRASVIIPLVIFLAVALGFSPTTFAFMTAAATGFCLTLPVSAKPVAMFNKVDGVTYTPRDLLRLSGALLPIHVVLLLIFAFFIWPALGLNIAQAKPETAPTAPLWSDDLPVDQKMAFGAVIDLGPNPYQIARDSGVSGKENSGGQNDASRDLVPGAVAGSVEEKEGSASDLREEREAMDGETILSPLWAEQTGQVGSRGEPGAGASADDNHVEDPVENSPDDTAASTNPPATNQPAALPEVSNPPPAAPPPADDGDDDSDDSDGDAD